MLTKASVISIIYSDIINASFEQLNYLIFSAYNSIMQIIQTSYNVGF